MTHAALFRRGLTVGVCLLGCSRGARDSRGGVTTNDASLAGDAGLTLVAPAPDASTKAAATLDGTPPVEIAVKGVPVLTLAHAGPALIELTLAEPEVSTWTRLEIERRPTGAAGANASQRDVFERVPTRAGVKPSRRHVHAARPGASYVYRARSGKGPWSAEVIVRTPAPGVEPRTPASLHADAISPFAVRLTWEADARIAVGFELEIEKDGRYVRAALVDPTARELVHNRRLPGQSYAYRIRAWNDRGASGPSTTATIKTPDRDTTTTALPLPSCTRLPPERDPAGGMPRQLLNGGAHLLYNDPDGASPIRRHLLGEYEGCMREFGAFDLQADVTEVPGFSDEGWPLLHAIAGAGQYVGASIQTLRFARGRYTVVNEASLCGEPSPDPDPTDPALGSEGADLLSMFPPFVTCQRD